MPDLGIELREIIKNERLTPVFQPIVCLKTRQIFGYEALIRGPSSSSLHSPLNLFKVADSTHQTYALEQVCRRVILRQFAKQSITQKLFINFSPSVFTRVAEDQNDVLGDLNNLHIDPSQLVLEITEYQPTDNYIELYSAAETLRERGFKIALDDLGAGYSGLRLWTELMPDFVKIDRHFIKSIEQDLVKLNFVQSIHKMAEASQCMVVAEGIETDVEYQTIQKIGVDYAQGYYFAKPTEKALQAIDANLLNVNVLPSHKPDGSFQNPTTRIEQICQKVEPIQISTSNQNLLHHFQKNKNLHVLPVVDGDKPCGLIQKDQFLSSLFTSRFGIELFGNKSVTHFIDESPLIFDYQEPIEKVSEYITHHVCTDSAFILTKDGRYHGIATLMDLLQVITSLQVQNARHSNPLTMLPGVIPTNQMIDHLLEQKTSFSIAYVDLDHFKPFNDIYGYDKGDDVIQFLAGLLTESISDDNGAVGHIGGDDFILVLQCDDAADRCQTILKKFESKAPAFYSSRHQIAGGIQSSDRNGKACFYPFLAVSIGMVDASITQQCESHINISDLATEAKHHAKQQRGNTLFINRRSTSSMSQPLAG